MIIALIVMVAMTMAGLAMIRSTDTSTLIAGNLAFKQSATLLGDSGVESAVTWLTANSGSLTADNAGNGYYATSQNSIDLTGNKTSTTGDDIDWSNSAQVKILPVDATTKNQIAYVIHRMCDSAGALDGATCSVEQTAQAGGSSGGNRQMTTYQPGTWDSVVTRGFYRITVMVKGPAKNVSFVQAIISI